MELLSMFFMGGKLISVLVYFGWFEVDKSWCMGFRRVYKCILWVKIFMVVSEFGWISMCIWLDWFLFNNRYYLLVFKFEYCDFKWSLWDLIEVLR